MIVKNEEENLRSCLEKVAPFVNEIILVDTGSTDNTKVIASEVTEKIYDFEWCNDFSKARNFGIKEASNEWVFVLDADEYVMDFNVDSVQRFISNPENYNKIGRIKRINVMEDPLGNKKYIERVNRIFNSKYFHYSGIIHEQVVAMDGKSYETENIDIICEHRGYTKEVLNKTNKLRRNIDLLDIAIKNNSQDPYLYYQLGKSYFMLKEYNTASTYFEKALSLNLNFNLEYASDLVETYGYSLVNGGRCSDALRLEQWIEVYKNIPDFHFLLGIIYMNNAKFTKAVESFLSCTEFSHGKVEGITTYLPYYNVGIIFDVLDYREEAIQYYKKCGNYEPAQKRLNGD